MIPAVVSRIGWASFYAAEAILNKHVRGDPPGLVVACCLSAEFVWRKSQRAPITKNL